MKVVATYNQPSSVIDCISVTLPDDGDVEYLVVARPSILEIYVVLPDALRLQCTFDVWGRVVSLHPLPVTGFEHHLLVLTDHPDPRVLLLKYTQAGAESRPELKCLDSLSLYERNARPAEFFSRCFVDRRGRAAVVSAYVGKLRVLELEDGRMKSNFDVSVRELNIISMCFIHTVTPRPLAVAILYKDHRQANVVSSHDINLSSKDISESSSPYLAEIRLNEGRTSSIVPIPPFSQSRWNTEGGIMIFTDHHIIFYSLDKKKKKKREAGSTATKSETLRVDWSYSEIITCTRVDAEGLRFLLGDVYGRLVMLAFDLENPLANLLYLGQISPPTALAVLSSQFVYVGSHYGDAQLVRIVPDRSSRSGNFLEVVESYENIAPVMDAISADIDGSGQLAIITCSGAKGAGCLRIVRNGANFSEDARIEGIQGIRRMWPLKRRFRDEFHSFLLVSTHASSHHILLPEADNEKTLSLSSEIIELKIDAPTLAAANVLRRVVTESGKSTYEDSAYFVQVTSDAVLLSETSFGNRECLWVPGENERIVLADTSPSQVCIALTSGKITLLKICADKLEVQREELIMDSRGQANKISALSLSYPSAGAAYSTHVVLGFWSTHEVKIFSLPFFLLELVVHVPHLPRSTLLYDFGNRDIGRRTHLMVGMADGNVAHSQFSKGVMRDLKIVALGELPVSLNVCVANGRPAVIASGSRNALFTWNEEAISHSLLLLKDVNAACCLHTPMFSNSIAMSLTGGLVIGNVQKLDKLHIRAVSLGREDPCKLAFMEKANVLGVGCITEDSTHSSTPSGVTSTFKIIDAASFETHREFLLDAFEEVTAVATVHLEVQELTECYFAVGSVYYDEGEQEPGRGRLLLFSRQLGDFHISSCVAVRGSVYALASIHGRLIAAINTSIVVFFLQRSDDNTIRLVQTSEWNHNYMITSIVISGDYIVTGDAVASLAVLHFVNDSLVTVARDYAPLWPLCIDINDEQAIIGANSDSNLFSFNIVQQGDRKLLERDGFYYFGDTVNKIISAPRAVAENKFGIYPSHTLLTSSGRISVVIDLDDEISRLLSELERNMSGVVYGPGNLSHGVWRAPTTSRGRSDVHATAVGFLDGDFLERFLDYSETSSEVASIIAGKNDAETLKAPYTHLRSVLESLRSAH